MSYTVTFYEVDLETIKKTLGSRDLSILDKTKFDEEDKEGLECARVLLTGGEQNPELGSQFGYAFEKIVEAVEPESIVTKEFESLHYGDFEGPLSWIEKSGPPVELPINDDYPVIGYRTVDDMKKFLDEWEEDNIDEYDPDIQEMIEGMLDLFQNAVKHQKDIISIYY